MKILHIYDEYDDPREGSVPSIIFHTSRYIVREGHDICILVLDRGWGRDFCFGPSMSYETNIRFVRLKAKSLASRPYEEMKKFPLGTLRLILDCINAAIKVYGFLGKNDFEIIHIHFPFAANILINLSKDLGKKMVYTAHIGEERKRLNFDSRSPLALKIFLPDLYLMRRVKKSVVLNEPVKSKLIQKGIEEERLEVIPNGVEVKEYGNFSNKGIERVKEEYGVGRKTMVMFAGTVTPRKGVDTLLKAANILVNKHKRGDILFLVVGNLSVDEEFASEAEEYVKSHNMEGNVKLTGFVSRADLKVLYSACDIFVLPSFEEGDPIALKEALASGKPLIGSNVGGIPMQIREGWNGFLVEPGNERQLAEMINHLADHPQDIQRMGRNSRKLAEENFDWSKITRRYLKVYEEIVRCEGRQV